MVCAALPRRGAVAARLDLALSPDDRQARPVDEAFGRSQPPARGARPCHQARHAGRCDFHRRRGQPSLTCAAASIRATPTLVSRASATRPISATRRIWRWTRRAASCVRLRMTSANVHASRLGEALIQGDEQGFFADRAYDS
jgi:hypothetical protein